MKQPARLLLLASTAFLPSLALAQAPVIGLMTDSAPSTSATTAPVCSISSEGQTDAQDCRPASTTPPTSTMSTTAPSKAPLVVSAPQSQQWTTLSDQAGNNYQATIIDPPGMNPLEVLVMNGGNPFFFWLPSAPSPTPKTAMATTPTPSPAPAPKPEMAAPRSAQKTPLASAQASQHVGQRRTAQAPVVQPKGVPTVAVPDTSLCPPSQIIAHLSVTADGFVDAAGQAWNMHGMNATVQDALDGFPNVVNEFPGMTAIRLNVDPSKDTLEQISMVMLDYNSKGIFVQIEDHSGQTNIPWYSQMAAAFKDVPGVIMETPNEPTDPNTAQNQIAIIKAIRAAGFINPIAVQPLYGYDNSNLATVTNAVGTQNLFVTPHIYGTPWQASAAAGGKALGLFAAIDESGNAMDGFTIDPQGQQVVDSVIADNKADKMGAVFWAMDNGNHADGADSVCADRSCGSLTSMGRYLQSWLVGNRGTGTTAPVCVAPQSVAGLASGPTSPVMPTQTSLVGSTTTPQ